MPPDVAAVAAAASDTGSCADKEEWYANTKFSCPSSPTYSATALSATECCSTCDKSPFSCSHWTFDPEGAKGMQCIFWAGRDCKRSASAGAISFAPRHPSGPSPSPSGNEMPVYNQMLWDADLYVGKLATLLKQRGMWQNLVMVYSAECDLLCNFFLHWQTVVHKSMFAK
eukprot:SAG31_NODE_46_length_30980_cov_226.095107_25_plen_170_part_00